jgi:hypothetical protein
MIGSATAQAEILARVTTRLQELSTKEDRFLDLIGDPEWPQDKIATRLRDIRNERGRLSRQLDDDQAARLETARETLMYLLGLLEDPPELYRRASRGPAVGLHEPKRPGSCATDRPLRATSFCRMSPELAANDSFARLTAFRAGAPNRSDICGCAI